MTFPEFLSKLYTRGTRLQVAGLALLLLVIVYVIPWKLDQWTARERAAMEQTERSIQHAVTTQEILASNDAVKTLDLEQLKAGISGNATLQKSLFESGLSLQEERRLLEKQLEIMTTTLLINPSLQRIFLMRGEQPLQSYLLRYIPIKSYAGAAATLPAAVRITSKERYAHPERGKAEQQVDGTLQWVPPQVGTSVRSNALGEFVMFTNSALILHGPPVRDEDHERFPHICLGLDREAAQKLYRGSFIGTKVLLSGITIEAVQPLPALTTGTTNFPS